MTAKIPVVLVVEAGHQASIDELVSLLRPLGLTEIKVNRALGVISGVMPADLRTQLAAVPGVAAVETSRDYRLPSPDQDLQ